MSEIKLFEVRDRGTCMSVMAIKPTGANEAEHFLWGRAGYGDNPETQRGYVLLVDMSDPPGSVEYDAYAWNDRTLTTAHQYICENFHALDSGQVIDVQFILSETAQPKISERLRLSGSRQAADSGRLKRR